MMLITDKNALENYKTSKRLWQGIPSIEVTRKGRIFLTFYSGGVKEEIGNFVVLIKSDDGTSFSEPITVAYEEGHRCFDPCLWIDPLGRLWLTWSRYPDDGLFAAICDDPDADEIVFGKEFLIGHNVMMNKPSVISTGEWLFPIAVWNDNMCMNFPGFGTAIAEKGAYAYVTADNGKTFKKLGYADVKNRSFDEHMILEMKDGSLRTFVRTNYGIGASDSYDGGRNWGGDFNTGYGGPSSRFYIRRLKSGRILLINHYKFSGRNNLTALLSEDEGKTFPYSLLLDGRSGVSYPDAIEAEDGYIYITYDRERGAFLSKLEDVMSSAREILIAKITEEDILQGHLVKKHSYLSRIANKLTDYDGDTKNPFNEEKLFDDAEYARYLNSKDCPEMAVAEIFDAYELNCTNIHDVDAVKLDDLIEQYAAKKDLSSLSAVISLIRAYSDKSCVEIQNLMEDIRQSIRNHLKANDSIREIAHRFNMSANYLQHVFRKQTGITIADYRNAQRLMKAKLLLKGGNDKIIDIATDCGYDNASSFTEIFIREVGMTPEEYRKIHQY